MANAVVTFRVDWDPLGKAIEAADPAALKTFLRTINDPAEIFVLLDARTDEGEIFFTAYPSDLLADFVKANPAIAY